MATIIKKITVGSPNRPLQIIASNVDADVVSGLVDSTYVNARIDAGQFLDSGEARVLIDSAYIQARQTLNQVDSATIQGIIDSAYIQARASTFDSSNAVNLIDSAYIQARQNLRDSSFVTTIIDSDYIIARASTFDSSNAIGLIDSAYIQARQNLRDSSFVTTIVDSAYVNARLDTSNFLDSAEAINLIDSAYVAARTWSQEQIESFAQGVSLDSSEAINLIDSAYINARVNSGNFLDSAEAIALIDSAYVNARLDDSLFLDSAEVINLIDSAYVNARLDTSNFLDSAEAINLIQPRIDSAVNALVDAAPEQLNTLNELAAALNDDSDAFNTLNTSISNRLLITDFDSKFDSALTTKSTTDLVEGDNLYYTTARADSAINALVDSAYVQARQAPGTDSAQVAAITQETIDSDYIRARQSNTATDLTLGTPTDGSLIDGAIQTLNTSTTIVDAIDDLNEALENVRNDSFVKSVTFVGSPLAGGAGTSVTLSLTTVGNPNRYDIYWGDGTVDSDSTDTTPSHTYTSNSGSPFNVKVVARNNSGSGTGSFAQQEREDYIIIYTADPSAAYAAYANPTGGSPINFWNDGDTVYFENNTTNIGSADVTYRWTWGDGTTDDVDSDGADGGAAGGRIAHTFALSTEEDVQRTTTLSLLTHETANPAVIPDTISDTFEIYDSHTPTVTLSSISGINEEGSSGHSVTFTNTTETSIGSYSTFGIQYQYTFGDGNTQTVNVGSGANGDTSGTINHTYTLSSSDQANGNSQDYTGNLRVISNHTSSPFISSDFTVHIEPDVRANIAGTAVTTSDGSSDNSLTIYNHTDLLGNNRALVRATNTSQNADNYIYTWGDGDSDRMNEDGSSAGTIAATIDHDYTGEGTGNKVVNFTSEGTPDITAQTDTESITFVMKAVPSAPSGLSSKSLSLSTSSQGTSPLLASGFTDNSSSNPLSAGDNIATSTARRYHSTSSISTNTIQNSYNGASGTVSVSVNGSTDSDASKTFTTALNENGTFASLIISGQVDYNDIDGSYPSNFYQTFDAQALKSLSDLSLGVNDIRLEHTETGNTNYVAIVKDSITSSPTIFSSGVLSENVGGTKRFISGVPYYNSGSPTLTLSGVRIENLVGQSYINASDIVEVDPGTNYEGTSSSAINSQNYSYSDIDGSITMLSGGIPIVNTGTDSAYTIGDLTIPVTSSSVRTIESPQIRAKNVVGTSSYSNISTQVQVHKASQSGINETAIPVDDNLGSTFDDDGVRVFDFSSATADTPSISGGTNFYTNNIYTESSDPGVEGTQEATVRLGVLKHDVTNYSSGYLPVGPNRSSDTGNQYFTFAFRRTAAALFNINIVTTGVEHVYVALPGSSTDNTSSANGWLDTNVVYNGAGVPGAGIGGNGSDGIANNNAQRIIPNTSLNGSFRMNFGTENMSNSTGNVVLVRIVLSSGQSVTSLSIS